MGKPKVKSLGKQDLPPMWEGALQTYTVKTTHTVVDAESGTHVELITVPLSKCLGISLVV